jgi:hypothetical protein
MKIRAKNDLTIYGAEVDTEVHAGDEFEVTYVTEVDDDRIEVGMGEMFDNDWASLIKSDWEIIEEE